MDSVQLNALEDIMDSLEKIPQPDLALPAQTNVLIVTVLTLAILASMEET